MQNTEVGRNAAGQREEEGVFETVMVFEQSEGTDTAGGLIGGLKILAGGRLEVAWVEPSRQSFLRHTVERMNGKASVAMPSDEPGDDPFVTRALAVPRGSPQFIETLWLYLHRYYGLRIV